MHGHGLCMHASGHPIMIIHTMLSLSPILNRPHFVNILVLHGVHFGVNLQSQVRGYVEGERIAGDARGLLGLYVYHAWLIIPQDEHNCFVITEETQHGLPA
jgi:hypothetical protein